MDLLKIASYVVQRASFLYWWSVIDYAAASTAIYMIISFVDLNTLNNCCSIQMVTLISVYATTTFNIDCMLFSTFWCSRSSLHTHTLPHYTTPHLHTWCLLMMPPVLFTRRIHHWRVLPLPSCRLALTTSWRALLILMMPVGGTCRCHCHGAGILHDDAGDAGDADDACC